LQDLHLVVSFVIKSTKEGILVRVATARIREVLRKESG
jgi:hypothetical protein